jgi:hypothetical protein
MVGIPTQELSNKGFIELESQRVEDEITEDWQEADNSRGLHQVAG